MKFNFLVLNLLAFFKLLAEFVCNGNVIKTDLVELGFYW